MGGKNSGPRRALEEHLIIRVDASVRIGTGHLMRCLALAQAWQDARGHVTFAMAMKAPVLEARLKSEGIRVIHLSAKPGSVDDAIETVDLARKLSATWVIADGYHFGANYQQVIKELGLRLLVIDDDGHAGHYYADIVLNQNLHSGAAFYANRESYTQLLLGIRYVLLRREFLKWREMKREIPQSACKVLVTLGGVDLQNNALKVIQSLRRLRVSGLDTVVVAGGSNPHVDSLEKELSEGPMRARLVRNVKDMAKLMAWADLAVSTAGTTVWELAFMGVPAIVGISAPIEELLVNGLKEHGLFLHIGWFNRLSVDELAEVLNKLINDKGERSYMSELGRRVVMGAGCDNVLKHLSKD